MQRFAALLMERVDPVLFALSRDFVGDTAETASLLWPQPLGDVMPPSNVSEATDLLSRMTRLSVMGELPKLLDRLDAEGRYALLKLATGAMRVGVSARLAKTAFAQAFGVAVEQVEEYWHALSPPFAELFAWAAQGAAPKQAAQVRPGDALPADQPHPLGQAGARGGPDRGAEEPRPRLVELDDLVARGRAAQQAQS